MTREKRYYVYVMASKGRVLYVGVTWEDLAAGWGRLIRPERAESSPAEAGSE
jgi:hypothetical protein